MHRSCWVLKNKKSNHGRCARQPPLPPHVVPPARSRRAADAVPRAAAVPPAVAARRGGGGRGGQACRLGRSGALEELRNHGSSPALVRLVSDAVQPEVVAEVAAATPAAHRAWLPLPLQLLPAAVVASW